MIKYIDAERFVEYFGDWYTEEGTEIGFVGPIKDLVFRMPAADVQEVRHGHWVYDKGDCFPKCSVCRQHHGTLYEYRYCPTCGAKMVNENE